MIRERLGQWLTRRFRRRHFADFDRYTAWVNWLRSPFLQQLCINPLLSGHPEKNWLQWLRETCFPKPRKKTTEAHG